MNDQINEYELPEFPAHEEPSVEEPVVETPPVGDESPVVSAPAEPQPVEADPQWEAPAVESMPEPKPPTKLQKLWQKVSVWLLGILAFALVLYLVFYFSMVRPLQQANELLTDANTILEDQLSEYRAELDELKIDHEAVTAERDDLLADTALYQGYVHFLDLKNDLLLLQKAYLEEDTDGATLALTKVNTDLEAFIPSLTGSNEGMADVLRSKVALLTTQESDLAANVQEVGTIYGFLIELEDDLFGGLE